MHSQSKETIEEIIGKLQTLLHNNQTWTSIERDIMLQYTRQLYESILQSEFSALIEAEPSPVLEGSQEEVEETGNIEDVIAYTTEEEVNIQEEEAPLESTITAEVLEERTQELEIAQETPTVQEEKQYDILQTPSSREYARNWSRDIRSYIGINDKYNFISELFGSNTEAYEEILNEMNACESATEAFGFLENSGVTTLYKWNAESFSTQAFQNILNQFFSSR